MRTAAKTALALFLAFQALYALTSSGNVFRVPDEFEVYFQTESLADGAGLAVPQTLAITEPVRRPDGRTELRSIFFGKVGRDGRPYAPYGPLAGVLALPHHLAARLVAACAGVPRAPLPAGRPWLVLVSGLTALATATAAALTVAGFFRAALLVGCPGAMAVRLAVVLGAATVLWPYGTSFYSEAFVACGLTWATVFLLAARGREGRAAAWRIVTACVLVALTGLVKATAIVLLPGFVAAVLCEPSRPPRSRMRAAAALAAAMLAAGLIHAGYNLARFGSPFDFGYAWAETVSGGRPRPFSPGDLPRGLLVLLASPGKSLFVWAPALVLAVLRLRAAWRRDRGLVAGMAASTAIALGYYGSYFFPEGGYAHGPRHLVPLVPLLLLGLAVAPPDTRRRRTALLAAAAAGFLVAALAVSTSFLQDQAMGQDLRGRVRDRYYERVVPRPGAPWNRYRLTYLPFVSTLASGQWGLGGPPGGGIDLFPLHLARARRLLPDMRLIPAWLPWALPVPWLLLGAAAWRLRRGR